MHACVQMNTATERLRMFENAAMHTDMLLTAKQAEMMATLVERDQVRARTTKHLCLTPHTHTNNVPPRGDRISPPWDT